MVGIGSFFNTYKISLFSTQDIIIYVASSWSKLVHIIWYHRVFCTCTGDQCRWLAGAISSHIMSRNLMIIYRYTWYVKHDVTWCHMIYRQIRTSKSMTPKYLQRHDITWYHLSYDNVPRTQPTPRPRPQNTNCNIMSSHVHLFWRNPS